MERYYDEAANPLWAEKKALLLAAPAPGTHEWKATEGASKVDAMVGWLVVRVSRRCVNHIITNHSAGLLQQLVHQLRALPQARVGLPHARPVRLPIHDLIP